MAELDGIEVFVKAVELSSMSAAARALGLAKSSVSREIARVERRLGVSLVQRTSRALRLTEAGAAYYASCADIIARAKAAEQEVSSAGAQPSGVLRITATVGFGAHYLSPLIVRYSVAYPAVKLEVQLLDRRVSLVEEGFDIAIRMGALEDSGLVARRLGAVDRVLCAHPDYLVRQGVPGEVDELRRHACLCVGVERREWVLGGQRIVVPWRLACNHVEVVRDAALAGAGVALLPRFLVAGDIKAGRLVPLLCDAPPAPAPVHALHSHGRLLSRSARVFLDLAIDAFGNGRLGRQVCE